MNSIYRRLFVFFFIVFYSVSSYGQNVRVAIQNNLENTVYAMVYNQFTVAVEGFTGKYFVETDNGTIQKETGENYYIWRPEHAGRSVVVVYRAKGRKDTLGLQPYKVVDVPSPTPYFANKKGGEVSYLAARLQIAPWATVFGGGAYGCANFKITEFTLIVVRDRKTILYKNIKGGRSGTRFSNDEEAARVINTLMPRDLVLFNDIKSIGPEGKIQDLSPMVFTITD